MKFERDERKFDFHDIGCEIKRKRETSGMTQDQLALIRYKKDVEITPEIAQELYDCAEMSAELDKRMETIQSTVSDDKDTLKNPT